MWDSEPRNCNAATFSYKQHTALDKQLSNIFGSYLGLYFSVQTSWLVDSVEKTSSGFTSLDLRFFLKHTVVNGDAVVTGYPMVGCLFMFLMRRILTETMMLISKDKEKIYFSLIYTLRFVNTTTYFLPFCWSGWEPFCSWRLARSSVSNLRSTQLRNIRFTGGYPAVLAAAVLAFRPRTIRLKIIDN